LNEGLSNFFAVDTLDGANKYNCEKCKLKANAKKRFYLSTVPQVMTFQLKRFTNTMRKIGKFIEYPKQFNAGKYFE
jgi:ubiquitin carboxyl-terminal hydrolase 36/42